MSGFATDLLKGVCWTNKNVKLWDFGHTHFNCYVVDDLAGEHVVANQRGYYFAQAEGSGAVKVVNKKLRTWYLRRPRFFHRH